jgi:hypothetical protein
MSFHTKKRHNVSTHRKVTTTLMLLVMNEVCDSTSPTARDWEQLVREKRVAHRLVEIWWRGAGTRPLNKASVRNATDRARKTTNLHLRCSSGAGSSGKILAVRPSVSVSHIVVSDHGILWGG